MKTTIKQRNPIAARGISHHPSRLTPLVFSRELANRLMMYQFNLDARKLLLIGLASIAILSWESTTTTTRSDAFHIPTTVTAARRRGIVNHRLGDCSWVLSATEKGNETPSKVSTKTPTLEEQGIVELATTTISSSPNTGNRPAAPPAVPTPPTFLSQGEIDLDNLNVNLSDPQQTRVILYIILSLIPVLFLIPFMLSSRELVPLDALPPVDL